MKSKNKPISRPKKRSNPELKETPVPQAVDEQITGLNFPIVGIGASAGGLTAFESFFAGMPA